MEEEERDEEGGGGGKPNGLFRDVRVGRRGRRGEMTGPGRDRGCDWIRGLQDL